MRRLWIYSDIDGVLVDSQPWVRLSYEHALGRSIPDDVWERVWFLSWREWLVEYVGEVGEAVAAHRRKNQRYRLYLESGDVRALPPARVLADLILAGEEVRFITGASETAAQLVLRQLDLDLHRLDTTECSPRNKLLRLSRLHGRGGVLVLDDNPWLVEQLQRRGVPAVQYKGESYDDLLADLRDRLWTSSS